jgi:hypothetical protein
MELAHHHLIMLEIFFIFGGCMWFTTQIKKTSEIFLSVHLQSIKSHWTFLENGMPICMGIHFPKCSPSFFKKNSCDTWQVPSNYGHSIFQTALHHFLKIMWYPENTLQISAWNNHKKKINKINSHQFLHISWLFNNGSRVGY